MCFGKIKPWAVVVLAGFAWISAHAQIVIPEHWSPYEAPTELPEGTRYHLIVEGDTLWDLAAQYLGDPLLWPQLYQANDYIRDPDLIYPGDPILLDVGVPVNGQTIAESLEDDPGLTTDMEDQSGEFAEMDDFAETETPLDEEASTEGDETTFGETTIADFDDAGSEFVILPAGDRSDIECSTYIYGMSAPDDVWPFDIIVSGGEEPKLSIYSDDDVMYLNKGYENGIQPGEIYSVRRRLEDVYYLDAENRRQYIGAAVDQIAKVRVLAVQANNATVIIFDSCREVIYGDFLVPYEQEPIPLITELPVVNRWDDFDNRVNGQVVYSEDKLLSFGKGHLANVNLGIDNNVAPGDLFVVYRRNPNNNSKKGVLLPDIIMGQAVALKTSSNTTVIKIIESHAEMTVGDLVTPLSSATFSE